MPHTNDSCGSGEGDYKGAAVRGVVELLSSGNSTLGKNAGLDKVGESLVNGLMNRSLTGIVNMTTEKKNGKTVLKKDK